MRVALTVIAFAVGSASVAQTPIPPADAAQFAAERAADMARPDSPGTGRFRAVKEVDRAFPNHVIYRPADIAALGDTKLGIMVWGNGGCSADGASARAHLAEIASHGYLVIAPGQILSGPDAPATPPTPRAPDTAGRLPPVKTTAADVLAGIDWALGENERKASRYYGKIDAKMVAVGGHSCGGLQALQVAGDPRVRTVLVHNSGIFADGSNPIPGITVDKTLLKTLHTPTVYFLGGPSDVAYPNGTDDFARIDSVPAVLVDLPVGHGGTFRQPNGGPVAQASVAWLDWQLRGDQQAARTFTGADCKLCADPRWTVKRKGL